MNNDYPLARAWLGKVQVLAHEIHTYQARIKNLRDASTNIIAQSSDVVRPQLSNTPGMEKLLNRIMELEKEVDAATTKLKEIRSDMIIHLDEWLEPDLATVLNLRHVKLLSWNDVCIEMDYSRSNIFRLNQKALESLEEILSKDKLRL